MRIFGVFSLKLFISARIPQTFLYFSGNSEDVNVDSVHVNVQVLLHHYGDVLTHTRVCVCWCHTLWLCEVRRKLRQVRSCKSLLLVSECVTSESKVKVPFSYGQIHILQHLCTRCMPSKQHVLFVLFTP